MNVGAMTEFFLALALFFASHLIPARPALRQALADRLGERLYQILYSALSLVLLVWLISAAARASYIPLWDLELWQYWVPIVAMVPALILFVGGAISPNPLSVSLNRRPFDPDRPGVIAITRHPMLWGFALWALAHVVPNGDLVSLIMFGGFGLFALAGMAAIDRRKKRQMGHDWETIGRRTALIPFAPPEQARLPWDWPRLLVAVLLGLLLHSGLLHLHSWLFGPDPMIAFAG